MAKNPKKDPIQGARSVLDAVIAKSEKKVVRKKSAATKKKSTAQRPS